MKKILVSVIAMFLIISGAFAQKDSIVNKDVVIIKKEKPAMQNDSILMEKLSSDQIMELKRQQMEVEKVKIEARSRNEMPLRGFHIILIVMTPFVFVIFILFIGYNFRNKDAQRRYELYLKSLESGQALPEHFFEEPKKQNSSSNLKKGIIALAVGLALVVSYLVIGNKFILIGGIIPAFIGLGFLFVHFLEKPKESSKNEQDR